MKATKASSNQKIRELRAQCKQAYAERDDAIETLNKLRESCCDLEAANAKTQADLEVTKKQLDSAQSRATQLEIEAGVRSGASGLTRAVAALNTQQVTVVDDVPSGNGPHRPKLGGGSGIAALYRREMARMSRVVELRDDRIRLLEKELAVQRVVQDSAAALMAKSSHQHSVVDNLKPFKQSYYVASDDSETSQPAQHESSSSFMLDVDGDYSSPESDNVNVPSLAKSVRFTPGALQRSSRSRGAISRSDMSSHPSRIPVSPLETANNSESSESSPEATIATGPGDQERQPARHFPNFRHGADTQANNHRSRSSATSTRKTSQPESTERNTAPSMEDLRAKLDAVKQHYKRLSAL